MRADRPTALRLARYLDELVRLEPQTIQRLFETRIECSEALIKHRTVQVWAKGEAFPVAEGGAADRPLISLLGILNGFFPLGPDGGGPIAFRVRRDARVIDGANLTKAWAGCAECERELEDREDLHACSVCGRFICDECVAQSATEDTTLCEPCVGRMRR